MLSLKIQDLTVESVNPDRRATRFLRLIAMRLPSRPLAKKRLSSQYL